MRMYSKTASSDARIIYGVAVSARLRTCDETASLSVAIDVANADLLAAQSVRRDLEAELVRERRALSAAEGRTHAAIRSLRCALTIIDEGRARGPAVIDIMGGMMFDRLSGRTLAERLHRLIQRLTHSTVRAVAAVRAEWQGKLRRALQALQDSIVPAERAHKAVRDARETEKLLRERHLTLIDGIMGRVRALFPGDKARQEWFFADLRARARRRAASRDASSGASTPDQEMAASGASTPCEVAPPKRVQEAVIIVLPTSPGGSADASA